MDVNSQAILKRALHELRELRELRAKVAKLEAARTEPIAVVGMACRVPGAEDIDGLWELLKAGTDAITEIPPERWRLEDYYDPDPKAAGKMCTRWGGFVRGVDQFDAQFFGISPREAVLLDPQQRLFLEVGWEALEIAGQSPDRLAGSNTGVFVGVTNYDYCQLVMRDVATDELEAYCATSNASTFAAGRLSYWLNFRGPSFSVDTACSSSLVAVHLACESLRSGECSMALAGGVNVLLSPEWFVVLSKAGMMSPDGRCKTFDRSANGYVRSEGCAVVVLKRLSDAIANRDTVYGLLRGSAINQDGRSGGITVPNASAQRDVVRAALERAGVPPSRVSYVEAHGTGTPLGDPIELRALDAVLNEGGRSDRVSVGSIKANIGHLESAAGVVGLLKVVLSLEHEQIPPQLHLHDVNPNIDLSEMAIAIPVESTPWPRGRIPRLAGVSSFGASGTNAHAIVEEAPLAEPASARFERPEQLLALSAKTPAALTEICARLSRHLTEHPELPLEDVCFTANTGRAHFSHRLALTAGDNAKMIEALDTCAQGRLAPGAVQANAVPGKPPKVAFLFTGQGSQYPGMTRELYAGQPSYRRALDECDALLRPHLERDLLSVLFEDDSAELLDHTEYTQPALFAVEYALAALWQSWGIRPHAVLGHSVGEYTAACVAGVLCVKDALMLIAKRGKLMQRVSRRGAMASVLAPAARVTRAVEPYTDEVSIAAINGPESLVISGDEDRVASILAELTAEGIKTKRLTVSHAFHSPHMDEMLDEFERAAASVVFSQPSVTLISNLIGTAVGRSTPIGPKYLRDHARAPVQFWSGMQHLEHHGITAYVELGPAPVLLGMAKEFAAESPALFLPSLRKGRPEFSVLLGSLGALYANGANVDFEAFDRDYSRRRVRLPTYPFQRKQLWFTPSARPAAEQRARAASAPAPSASLLGERVPSPSGALQFNALYREQEHPCLGHCRLGGLRVVNIGFYLEAALRAAAEAGRRRPFVIDELTVMQGFVLEEDEARLVHVSVEPNEQEAAHFALLSRVGSGAEEGWLQHAECKLSAATSPPRELVDLVELRKDLDRELAGDAFYRQMAARTLDIGPAARWIEFVSSKPGEAVARMRAPRGDEGERYSLHPGLVDSSMQILFACLPENGASDAIYMLVAIERVIFFGFPGGESVCHARMRSGGSEDFFLADVELAEPSGRVFCEFRGAQFKRAARDKLSANVRARAPGRAKAARTSAGDALAAVTAVNGAERRQLVEKIVSEYTATLLRIAPSELALDEPLQHVGLDSLITMELVGVLKREFGVSVPLARFSEGMSTRALAERVLEALPSSPAPREATGIVHDPEGRYRPFGLTDLQQAYLLGRTSFFELGNNSTYFFLEIDVNGLDLARFEWAFRCLIQRHDMLRAVFSPDGLQRVSESVPEWSIRRVDLRGRADEEVRAALEAIHGEMAAQVFPTDRFPLFDIRATVLDGGVTRIHLGFDALILDAWSTSTLFREWSSVYRDGPECLPALEITYRDYVIALEARADSEPVQRSIAYWKDRVSTLPPPPELPLAQHPSALGRGRFVHRSTRLDGASWKRFQDAAKRAGVTASSAVCAAYAEVLATWSKSSRFTLNVLYFNRLPLHAQVNQLMGNFSATSLLEIDSDLREGFKARAQRLQTQLFRDLDHAHVSGVRVLRDWNRVHGNRSRAGMPVVFASTINFRSGDDDFPTGLAQNLLKMGSGGREVASSIRTPQVWLDHQVVQEGEELILNWDVVEELFPAGMVDEMFATYLELLRQLADGDAAWNASRVLVPERQLEVRRAANATMAPIPEGLLHTGFCRAALAGPERIAVLAPGRTLRYGELDRESNRVANWLRAQGGKPGDLVAVLMHKGWEQIVAVIGVLKSGAAYVPIDARLPEERVRHLLDHGRVKCVLTQARVARAAFSDLHSLSIDELGAATDEAPLDSAQRPTDLAYVIYTSGSTGLPKGVMIEHRAALNTVVDINERLRVGADDRVLALSALSFDLSVYDVFGPLAVGGAVVLPDPGAAREPMHWQSLISEHCVTLWNSVPALMQMFVDYIASRPEVATPTLRAILMSGDWIPVTLPERIRSCLPSAAVYSLGGATEASIWSIIFPIEKVESSWVSIPYGKALLNQQMYVLNDALQPCPEWVTGQIYIGGIGVARGYWGDPEKTRASFVRHPVSGERLYRTGDLGRFLPDGNIEFLGREDGQVKIQGYRIELGEIEAALAQHEAVRLAAAVAVGEKHGNKRLLGFVELKGESRAEELRALLRGKLPEYAIPQSITIVESFPLSSNGKVDRAALVKQARTGRDEGAAFAPPRDEVETALVGLWQEVLNCQEVGIHSNFFDLGGHSVLAVRLLSRIRQQFGRELPLMTLFEHPTIEQLARALGADRAESERRPLVRVQPEGSRRPLFCVHPVGGNVFSYAALARELGRDQPLYGLQQPESLVGRSIDAMAERYVAALREVEPHGPYRLLGWSMGGIIAFEMARQLTGAGAQVELLAMVDVIDPPRVAALGAERLSPALDAATLAGWFVQDFAASAGKEVALDSVKAPGLSLEARFERVVKQLSDAALIPPELDTKMVQGLLHAFGKNHHALLEYEAKPYRGPILFVRGTRGRSAAQASAEAWIRHTGSGRIVALDGDHYGVVQAPLVTELARELSAELRPAS